MTVILDNFYVKRRSRALALAGVDRILAVRKVLVIPSTERCDNSVIIVVLLAPLLHVVIVFELIV
jgi:hypothetical protein